MTAATARVADADDDIGGLVADSATGVLGPIGLISDIGARESAEQGRFDDRAWTAVADAGFPLGLLDADAGGVGAVHGGAIVRIAGEAALAMPLVEAMGANWLLDRAGLPPRTGPLSFAADPLTVSRVDDGWHVKGRLSTVPWARGCDIVVPCTADGGASIAIIERGRFVVTEGANMAGEPRDGVEINTVVPHHQVGPCAGAAKAAIQLGAGLRAMQIAGALSGISAMTLDHVRDRRQFGRPIAGFQAVQQLLAQIVTQVSAARCAAELAFEHIQKSGPDARASAIAKIRAGEAAGVVAAIAHQLHGAMGFTREHPLHLLTRRLWSWRDEFGGEAQWSVALGRDLAACGGGSALWRELTDIQP